MLSSNSLPGETQFTRIRGPRSCASPLTLASNAALATDNAVEPLPGLVVKCAEQWKVLMLELNRGLIRGLVAS